MEERALRHLEASRGAGGDSDSDSTLESDPVLDALQHSDDSVSRHHTYNRYHIQMVIYESAKNRKGQSGIVDKFAFLWCLLRSMKKQGKTVFSVAVFLSGGKCV